MNKNISIVFRTDKDGRAEIYPPAQIFANKDFKFLIGLGGYLVDNNQEYDKLMAALQGIGETRLHIVEQQPNEFDAVPFVWELPTKSSLDTLEEMDRTLDPSGRFAMVNVFVYGDNPNWGIYVCEYPTILIIGCIEEYVDIFRKVYGIKGNGFAEQDDFISREYGSRPYLRDELIKNYHLYDEN